MTPDGLKRRAEAIRAWALRHQVAVEAEGLVGSGIRWALRLDPPGPDVPRVGAPCSRDLCCGDKHVYLAYSLRRLQCSRCGGVKTERLDWLADNPPYTKRFAFFVGRRCRETPVQEVAEELGLDWHTVQELDKQYMQEQLRRAGNPAPRVLGIDEMAIAKGHRYRIVVSDLGRGRAIWFGGQDRSEASLDQFFAWLGPAKCGAIRPAVMDMWQAFRASTLKEGNAPQAAILYDKFHVLGHLGEAMDRVRKREYARLSGGRSAVRQGAALYVAGALGEPLPGGAGGVARAVRGQPAAEQGVPPQGALRPAVGLPEPGLGPALL
jgi:hypothetical protein